MSQYGVGDIILVNGTRQRITSYPQGEDGFASTVYKLSDGGEVQNTYNIKDPNLVIELVEKATGEVESTAGPVPDVAPEPKAPPVKTARKAAAK